MKKDTLWLLIGGIVLVGAGMVIMQMSNKRKKDDDTLSSATLDRNQDIPDMPNTPTNTVKSAGQTIAESFAVILRRDSKKPAKVKKTPKKA